jgi:hypothetical protein
MGAGILNNRFAKAAVGGGFQALGAAASLGGLAHNDFADSTTAVGHNITNPNANIYGQANPSYVAQQQQKQAAAKQGAASGPANPAGAYTGGSGGSGADYSAELGNLNSQEGLLRALLGHSGVSLDQGITQINDDYNKNLSNTNLQRSRALEDFNTKQKQTELAKGNALERSDTQTRTLANSIRQKIARASGSGSSAYQITAPGAIAKQASEDRQGLQENYAQNFMALDTAQKRAAQDYDNLIADLGSQRGQKEKGLREGVLSKEQEILGSLGDIARRKAAIGGGGAAAVQAAGAPFQGQVDQRRQAIDALFGQFRTPYSVKPVDVQNPTLRDYVVNGAKVGNNQQAQTDNPADLIKKQLQDEQYNPLFG